MAAQVLPWIQATEEIVGLNHPTKADIENRPLRQLLSLIGLNPDAAFIGLGPVFLVKAHGGIIDGVADDTVAAQATLDAASAATVSRMLAVGGVGALSYAVPEVRFSKGTALISARLNIGYAAYITGDIGSYIQATANTFDIFGTAAENGFAIRMERLHLINGKRQIVLTRSNIDTSMNVIADCTFSSGDYTQPAIYLSTQSCTTLILRPRVLSRPYFLDNEIGDEVCWDGGWCNGYPLTSDGNNLHKPANTASVVHKSAGAMTVRNVLFVPEPEGNGAANANTRWFDNYGRLYLRDNHFGAENAGFPIVYNFASTYSNVAQYIGGAAVEITGGLCYAGAAGRTDRGVLVCKTAVPAIFIFEGVQGPSDSKIINTANMVLGDLVTPVTLATWLASVTDAHNPKIAIRILDNTTWGISGTDIVPLELQPYAEWNQQGVNGTGNTHFIGGRLVLGAMAENTAGASLQAAGLTFPAAQVASADGNTLDDYEELDFTPNLTFGGASVGMTFTIRKGSYTKKGREVTAKVFMVLSAKGSSIGNAVITGFPFTVRNDDAGYAPVALRADTITFVGQLQGYAPKNTTTVVLEQITEAGVITALTHANFANTSAVLLTVTYDT